MEKSRKPKIRFKGYNDDWEQRELGNIGQTYTGLSGKTKDDFGHGHAQFVTYMNVFSNPISNPKMNEPIEVDSKQNEVEVGDVFFTTSSETPKEVGMTSVLIEKQGKMYLNSFCFGYRLYEKYDSYYLAYMLRSNSFREKIIMLAQGISRYNISKNKVMEIDVFIPSYKEQMEIGKYFRDFDTLITLHQRKLEKLMNVKKSMLEKMFPKQGSVVPEIRFCGFTDAWEQRKLSGILCEKNERTSDFNSFPLYSLTIENGITPKTNRYERSSLVTKTEDLFKIVNQNEFVTNPMNLRFGALGYNKNPHYISVSGYYDVFSIDNDKCSAFWNSYFKTISVMTVFDNAATGSLIEKRRVKYSTLKQISLLMPIELREKQKIGSFFEDIDELITLHQRKLEKLKNIKKSMLEKMFI